MPTLPETSGLPVWAQILVSVLVCLATLGVAFKGYFTDRPKNEIKGDQQTTVALAAATLMDMGSLRHLSDTIVQLNAAVLGLTEAVNESTHYNRNEVEVQRELCARLRSLCEEIERAGRWTGKQG
ncbi:MAG TPA: hypothetical protein VK181_06655 [Rhizobium sp.]|nr:hypothetical protein [Rhizobium sp.]